MERTLEIKIGEQIRNRRMKRGWTIEQLAEAIMTTNKRITLYEQGHLMPSFERLYLIIKILDSCDNLTCFFADVEGIILRE